MPSNAPPPAETPLPELLQRLSHGLSGLVCAEVTLARTELTAKAKAVARPAVSVMVGAGLALVSLLVFVAAAALGLIAAGLPAWAATLAVAVVLLAVGGLLAWSGVQALKKVNLVPTETLRSLKEDAAWAKSLLH